MINLKENIDDKDFKELKNLLEKQINLNNFNDEDKLKAQTMLNKIDNHLIISDLSNSLNDYVKKQSGNWNTLESIFSIDEEEKTLVAFVFCDDERAPITVKRTFKYSIENGKFIIN